MAVGRRRKDGNPQGLEKRVYWHHGQYRYRHRDGHWEELGTDVALANAKAQVYNRKKEAFGTVGFWIRFYLAEAKANRLPAGRKLRDRTIADYEESAKWVEASPVWNKYPQDLIQTPKLLADYRDNRVDPETGKGETRANRDLSMVSSMFTWLIEESKVPGLIVNPVKLIKRFSEEAKDRYVDDLEYRPVYGIAQRSICMGLALAYRTLQRPEDLLLLPPAALTTKSVAGISRRVLTVHQRKTGMTVHIELTDELEQELYMLTPDGYQLGTMPLSAAVTKIVKTLIHTTAGRPYTIDGFGSMLRRYCNKAGVQTFGLMDVRAKGATDMYINDVPIEHIRQLMGHASVQTTEIYIKRLLNTVRTAQPNQRAVSA
jgi:integrase